MSASCAMYAVAILRPFRRPRGTRTITKEARNEVAISSVSLHGGVLPGHVNMMFSQQPRTESNNDHASTSAARQNSGQQPSPQVFFPMAEQPEMEMHHHSEIPEVMPQFPRLGNSQRVAAGPVYQLDDLKKMATEHNPTLDQAQRAVETARGRQWQSGLYPNPTVGYEGEEIRGGAYGGGEQGFFVEQPIILGGKLGLNRKVGAGEVKQRQAEAEAQRLRVENDVRVDYSHVLAAKERRA